MGTIKLRRGSGSPAGSIEQNEVAMDVAAKTVYTSTDGSDAVVLADNTENFLETNTTELDITSDIDMNNKVINNLDKLDFSASSSNNEIVYNGNLGSAFNFQSLKISSKFNPNLTPDLSSANNTFQISNFYNASQSFLNDITFQTENRHPFFGMFVEDTGTGDDGSHNVAFSLKGNDSLSGFNQLQSFTAAQAQGQGFATNLDITGAKVSFYSDEYRLPTSDGTNGQVLTTNGSGDLTFEDAETITLATLKSTVAASSDFADFKTRIAAL